MYMLTKPQVFYDDTHKQALDYQNLFYLKKAQRIKPTLYDGSVISKQHVSSPVFDDEETLILEEDFGKRFVPQRELSNEQAFWLQTSHPNNDQSASSPVKIKAPRELPKVSLVNTSLKKLKNHLDCNTRPEGHRIAQRKLAIWCYYIASVTTIIENDSNKTSTKHVFQNYTELKERLGPTES
ncbi:hypothetical protein Tco_1230149 [Tanacetum coccineum]